MGQIRLFIVQYLAFLVPYSGWCNTCLGSYKNSLLDAVTTAGSRFVFVFFNKCQCWPVTMSKFYISSHCVFTFDTPAVTPPKGWQKDKNKSLVLRHVLFCLTQTHTRTNCSKTRPNKRHTNSVYFSMTTTKMFTHPPIGCYAVSPHGLRGDAVGTVVFGHHGLQMCWCYVQ